MGGAHEHGAGPESGAESGRETRLEGMARIPFWVHQIVELLLGLVLLVQGARTGEHTAALVTMGGLLVLLALCTDGPLGAWSLLGRRTHRVLDVVAAVALAASPLLLGVDHVVAIVVVEAAALGLAWLAWRSDWRPRARARKAAAPRPTPPPSTAPDPAIRSAAAERTPAPDARPVPDGAATPLARRLGEAAGRARDDGPRQLGRLVGRATRATRSRTGSGAPSVSPSPPSAGPSAGPSTGSSAGPSPQPGDDGSGASPAPA
jgi:hypothetical protein